MVTNINCIKSNEKIKFSQVSDRDCFYSGGVLYMKILESDLHEYGIDCINAISIVNAGLTKFDNDENVYKVTKEIKTTRE